MRAALVTDASVLALKVSICLRCFQIVIQKRLGFSLLIVSEIILYCYSTFFEYSSTTTYYIFLYIFRWSCRTPIKMYKDCFHLKLRWKCWRKWIIVETRIRPTWKAKFKLCSRFYILLVLSKLKFKKASRNTSKIVQVAIHWHLFCTGFHKLHGLVTETAIQEKFLEKSSSWIAKI